jgi:hypothetical protein
LRGQRRISPVQIACTGVDAAGVIDAIYIADAHAAAPANQSTNRPRMDGRKKSICVTMVRQQEGGDPYSAR